MNLKHVQSTDVRRPFYVCLSKVYVSCETGLDSSCYDVTALFNMHNKHLWGSGRTDHNHNIKMYLTETGWVPMDWIHQDRNRWRAIVNKEMNLRGQIKVGNFLTS